MTTAVLPDLELLVSRYLQDHDAVQALVPGRVGTRTPRDIRGEIGWLRVRQLDTIPEPSSRAMHLSDGMVQIDCYGGGAVNQMHAEASQLARTVQAAVNDMPGTHDDVVITKAKAIIGPRLPDEDIEPPRERFPVTVTLTYHPA